MVISHRIRSQVLLIVRSHNPIIASLASALSGLKFLILFVNDLLPLLMHRSNPSCRIA